MSTFEFKGNDLDKQRLLNAINHNCECPKKPIGQPILPGEVCPPHRMLLDEVIIDHLLFSRSRRSQMLHQEFGVTKKDMGR